MEPWYKKPKQSNNNEHWSWYIVFLWWSRRMCWVQERVADRNYDIWGTQYNAHWKRNLTESHLRLQASDWQWICWSALQKRAVRHGHGLLATRRLLCRLSYCESCRIHVRSRWLQRIPYNKVPKDILSSCTVRACWFHKGNRVCPVSDCALTKMFSGWI